MRLLQTTSCHSATKFVTGASGGVQGQKHITYRKGLGHSSFTRQMILEHDTCWNYQRSRIYNQTRTSEDQTTRFSQVCFLTTDTPFVENLEPGPRLPLA